MEDEWQPPYGQTDLATVLPQFQQPIPLAFASVCILDDQAPYILFVCIEGGLI